MKTSIEYSAYQAKWVVIDNYSNHIWKYQERELNKLGFAVIRQMGKKYGIVVKHYSDNNAVLKDAENIKKAWIAAHKKDYGVGAIITDKQFGMMNVKDVKNFITLSTVRQREQFSEIIK